MDYNVLYLCLFSNGILQIKIMKYVFERWFRSLQIKRKNKVELLPRNLSDSGLQIVFSHQNLNALAAQHMDVT